MRAFCPECAGDLVKHGAQGISKCRSCGRVWFIVLCKKKEGSEYADAV